MDNIIFWVFMLICLLLVPATMIIFGLKFQKAAPKNINNVYGYRTEQSMKNRDTWEYAHASFGRLWKIWGIVLAPVTIAAMLPLLGKDVGSVGWISIVLMAVQLAAILVPLIMVERRLKKTFDKYGRRITRE